MRSIKKCTAVVLSAATVMTCSMGLPCAISENENPFGAVTVQAGETTTVVGVSPDGSGTETSPYEISTSANLVWLSDQAATGKEIDYHIKLMNDIDMTDIEFLPIYSFSGVFDGNDHKITFNSVKEGETIDGYSVGGILISKLSGELKNLTVAGNITIEKTPASTFSGLVSHNYKGSITDCTSNINITIAGVAPYYMGSIVGTNDGKIERCVNNGTITSKLAASVTFTCGGIVGNNQENAIVKDCVNNGKVNNTYITGGIAGTNSGSVINSHNTADITTSLGYVGGICGNLRSGEVKNCYNTGNIENTNEQGGPSGGIAGNIQSVEMISNCYNSGNIKAASGYLGGIAGVLYAGSISNCYHSGSISIGNENRAIGASAASVTVSDVYCLNDSVTQINDYNTPKTTEQFNSGEVAYLLQGEATETVWGQAIGTESFPVLNGTKVYKNALDIECDTTNASLGKYYTYSNTEGTQTVEHYASTGGLCKVCGKPANGKDGFKSASVTITDGVILNYYLVLDEAALADNDAYVHFTGGEWIDKKIKLSEGESTDGGYKFGLELRPDNMSVQITAEVVYGDGTKGSKIDYSVKKYIDTLIKGAGEDSELVTLANKMLEFGAYSQLYTERNTDNLAADVKGYDTNAQLDDSYKYSITGEADGVTVTGAALLLGANTTISVKCSIDGDIQNYEFKCNNEQLTPVKEGEEYYVYLQNIRPQNLDTMYKFEITNGDGKTVTLNYSAFSYMKNILDNSEAYDNKLVNLLNVMYDYNVAAKAVNK